MAAGGGRLLVLLAMAVSMSRWASCFLVSSWSLRVVLAWSLELASKNGLAAERALMAGNKRVEILSDVIDMI